MALAAKLNPGEGLGDRVLKVNHAGENGAVNIYAAQMMVARLTAPSVRDQLAEFLTHERRHREIFGAELASRGVRRCRSFALCGAGGYALGLLTALFGRAAIAATTVAVERVVLRHLESQINTLAKTDPPAVAVIQRIVEDEQAHHDRSLAQTADGGVWVTLLTPVVSAATECVIWLGMRL